MPHSQPSAKRLSTCSEQGRANSLFRPREGPQSATRCNGALSTTVPKTRHTRLRLEEDLIPDLEGRVET